MKNSIKLKYGKELEAIMGDPIKLSILVQIAFNTDEETGEAEIVFIDSWKQQIKDLVLLGLISHENFAVFRLENKKIIDITLKKKPKKSNINSQFLSDVKILPKELEEYYKIAKSFQELFYKNIKSIDGRVLHIDNAKFGAWVNPIRLMMENDRVTREQLREVWQFLNKDKFWKDKVQSTAKLRQKFNTLYNQAKANERREAEKMQKEGAKVSKEYLQNIVNDLQD